MRRNGPWILKEKLLDSVLPEVIAHMPMHFAHKCFHVFQCTDNDCSVSPKSIRLIAA